MIDHSTDLFRSSPAIYGFIPIFFSHHFEKSFTNCLKFWWNFDVSL